MSEAVKIEVAGLDELEDTLEKIPKAIATKVMRGTMKDTGEFMRDKVVEEAPYRTGFLAEHFDVKVRVRSDEIEAEALIGPEGRMYYPGGDSELGVATGKHPHSGGLVPVASVARFLEFGTSKMNPKPFMTTAFEGNKDGAMIKIIQGIKDALAGWLNL